MKNFSIDTNELNTQILEHKWFLKKYGNIISMEYKKILLTTIFQLEYIIENRIKN